MMAVFRETPFQRIVNVSWGAVYSPIIITAGTAASNPQNFDGAVSDLHVGVGLPGSFSIPILNETSSVQSGLYSPNLDPTRALGVSADSAGTLITVPGAVKTYYRNAGHWRTRSLLDGGAETILLLNARKLRTHFGQPNIEMELTLTLPAGLTTGVYQQLWQAQAITFLGLDSLSLIFNPSRPGYGAFSFTGGNPVSVVSLEAAQDNDGGFIPNGNKFVIGVDLDTLALSDLSDYQTGGGEG